MKEKILQTIPSPSHLRCLKNRELVICLALVEFSLESSEDPKVAAQTFVEVRPLHLNENGEIIICVDGVHWV